MNAEKTPRGGKAGARGGDGKEAEMLDVLSGEARELALFFAAIQNSQIRRCILNLLHSAAEAEI